MTLRFIPAIALLVLVSACGESPAGTAWVPPAPPSTVDGVLYTTGNWEPHLPAGEKGLSWGNHRAVVLVEDGHGDVQVRIPWRRLDTDPADKAIVVVDSASGTPVANAFASEVTAESGLVTFEAGGRAGTYYVYYLPWESTGGYYPKVMYPTSVLEPDAAWEARVRSADPALRATARTIRMESVNDFHSFWPMEVPATKAETAAFVGTADWVVVPEFGRYPIRTRHSIPVHWTGPSATPFVTRALRGESHTFQLGVYAAKTALEDVQVTFNGLPEAIVTTCYNCEGTSYTNEPLSFRIDIPAGELQPLWIGVQVPEDMTPGSYRGTATVHTTNAGNHQIGFVLEVDTARAENHGYDEPETQSRLAWLNSQAGRDADFIIKPYEPVTFEGRTLSILGRTVELNDYGLPRAIHSLFTEEMTSVGTTAEPILAAPMALVVTRSDGGTESFTSDAFTVTQAGRGRAEWTTTSRSEHMDMTVEGALEYDGMLDYRISVSARQDMDIADMSLPVAYEADASTWMLGLGQKGRLRPASLDWTWKVENHQEGVWMGAVNKGLQYVLRDENYERPLNTNFYQNQPLNMPLSWENGGKGGIRIRENGNAVTATNYSGPRTLTAGETLHFNIRFLITPFKPLDTKTHFNTRFVHKYVPVDSVIAWGGTVVNIHHANEINPYINYPFYNLDLQTAYIEEAHAKGIKVKLYNTIRELSYKAHELFAMRSLGEEIFNGGEGGGHSWMQEHLRENYHSAWHAWRVDDAAILNKGTSRWTNYYIEGLAWLASNQEIDGLYLDDIAFSRETVKRMISVMNAERDEVVIDLHSANQFNPRDGYTNSAMLYMEHFPFISRLWFGEYFEYGLDPDYWMAEVSGLPFGLMGEMLQDGGRPYRGMLYGMTARLYGDVDPRPVWKLMNDFGIADSRMLGFWLSDAPVTTGDDAIRATTYVQEDGRLMIALASWSDTDEVVSLDVDWARLGLPDGPRTWSTPTVAGLQDAMDGLDPAAIVVPADRGLFLLVE